MVFSAILCGKTAFLFCVKNFSMQFYVGFNLGVSQIVCFLFHLKLHGLHIAMEKSIFVRLEQYVCVVCKTDFFDVNN